MKSVKMKQTLMHSVVLFALTMPVAFAAKNFVFCSEASPEGFNPMLFATSPTNDATQETIYDRLMQFKKVQQKLI